MINRFYFGTLRYIVGSFYWYLDCSAAAQNILLAAESMGLGAVWTAAYPYEDRMEVVEEKKAHVVKNGDAYDVTYMRMTAEHWKGIRDSKKYEHIVFP